MSRRRLVWLVRARGTNLSLWPERERLAALAAMRQSPEARQAFAEALVSEEAPEVDGPVFERMQAALRRSLAPLPAVWLGLRIGALVGCVAAGLYLAAVQTDPDQSNDLFSTAQTISIAALDQ